MTFGFGNSAIANMTMLFVGCMTVYQLWEKFKSLQETEGELSEKEEAIEPKKYTSTNEEIVRGPIPSISLEYKYYRFKTSLNVNVTGSFRMVEKPGAMDIMQYFASNLGDWMSGEAITPQTITTSVQDKVYSIEQHWDGTIELEGTNDDKLRNWVSIRKNSQTNYNEYRTDPTGYIFIVNEEISQKINKYLATDNKLRPMLTS